MNAFPKITLKKIAIVASIPIVSFLAAFISIWCFYLYCNHRLQPFESDEFPPALQERGATLKIEPGPNETKTYTLSHGDATVSWVRSFDLINAWGPTFVAADVDGDRHPEIVLTFSSSGLNRECSSADRSGNLFHIDRNFLVYDLESDGISMACEIPMLYAMYFSDGYRSFFFTHSPIVTISTYGAIAASVIAGIRHLGLRKRSSSPDK